MTQLLALLPAPVESFLHLCTLRSLNDQGFKVHIVVETMDAAPLIGDPLDDFVQTGSVTDLSIEDYSSHSSILEEIIRARGISSVLQIGASMLYPLLPELKMKFPHLRIVDLLLHPHDHNWDHFLFENAIDAVIVESDFMLNVVRKSTLRLNRDIRVVRSGTQIEFKNLTGPKDRPLTIGYTGSLREEKAPLEFVKVAQHASRKFAADFKIFGTGPMEQEVRTAIKQAKFQNQVTMEGFARTNFDALSALDVLVVPSRFDGRPAAIMEASALGVVTIAAGVGGIPEMIQDGVNGFCLTPWSVSAAVEHLCALAEDNEMLNRMKTASRTFAQMNFDYSRMVREYAQFLCTT
jgi:glycosyltransferase involved in cell wall biosynthesis